MTTSRNATTGNGDAVELRVPADPAYLAVIRTTAAGLAARLEMTLDEIEDLRIAVDEACALLLQERRHEGDRLEARFTMTAEILEVIVSGPARNLPDRSSFAWTVLEALAGHVDTWTTSDRSWIRLSHEGNRRAR
jgi:serine/threonine-protein kinase RsbW